HIEAGLRSCRVHAQIRAMDFQPQAFLALAISQQFGLGKGSSAHGLYSSISAAIMGSPPHCRNPKGRRLVTCGSFTAHSASKASTTSAGEEIGLNRLCRDTAAKSPGV